MLGELLLPGLGVQHGVDVADPRLPRAPHLLLHHHPQLPALEHHSGIGGAGVVQLAGQQVQPNSKRLTRNRTAKTKIGFSGLFELKYLSYQLLTIEEWVPEKISILKSEKVEFIIQV